MGDDGLGVHQFWGSTPALDICAETQGNDGNDVGKEELHILVASTADLRHVLRTLSNKQNRSTHKLIHFYMYDNPIEVLARHLLLLHILMQWHMPIRHRANLFLEVFGNSLVQQRTAEQIGDISRELISFLCDDDRKSSLHGLVDLSLLKYRERDELEKVFKSWNNKVELNMPGLWDGRMRRFHGQRFDHRVGAFDWDYQQVIKPGSGVIHPRIYRDWRENGVAFEFGDQTYTQPNRSLASYAVGREGGLSKKRRGYWGDIRLGPFVSFGVDCPLTNEAAKSLFKVENKGTGCEQYRHTTVHVAVYHMISMLYEIETGKPYVMKKEHDVYSGLGHDDLLEKGTRDDDEKDEKNNKNINNNNNNNNHNNEVEVDDNEENVDADSAAVTLDSGKQEKEKQEKEKGGQEEEVKISAHKQESKPRSNASTYGEVMKETVSTREQVLRRIAAARAKEIVSMKQGVKITMLTGDLNSHLKREKFRGLFDIAFLSNRAAHFLAATSHLSQTLKPNASVLVEGVRFLPPINKEQAKNYEDKVVNLAAAVGLKHVPITNDSDSVASTHVQRFVKSEGVNSSSPVAATK